MARGFGVPVQPPAGAPPAAPITPPPGAPPAAPPPGAPPPAVNLPGIGWVIQNPDGSYTAQSGPYAGGKLVQTALGVGYIAPDGTHTLVTRSGPSLPTDPGQYGNSNGILDKAFNDNPLGGTLNAIDDAAHGNYGKAGGDFAQGATYGTVPVGGNTVPDATKALGKLPGEAGTAADAAGNAIATGAKKVINALDGAGGGGSGITTGDADAETKRANDLADALGGQAGAAGAQADTDRGLGTQTRAQQEQSISDLQDAAAGRVPSAAEMQLKQQSGIDAARQYGLAAALQGNNPAAALRQASMGAATVAGTTNQNAATLRATEQANARNALANTLTNVRAGDQGAVNTDVNQQGTLTQGQLTSQGQGVTSTGQKLTAETEKEKADAIKQGALYSAGGALGAGLLSDKRAKKDIVKASLADALGKGVHGVTFEYRPESGEDDTPHFGVLADQLERVVPGVVKRDPSGFKAVDTGHLTLGNTAILAELAARLMDLEKKQGARRG